MKQVDTEAIYQGYKLASPPRMLRSWTSGCWRKMSIGSGKYPKYTLLPRLSRYVLNGRYHIDNNGVENAIRLLAVGRKNYLFCGNHDAAVGTAIVYSLFSSCKAHDIDVRIWLVDILKRIPTEKDINQLLPGDWKVLPTNSR